MPIPEPEYEVRCVLVNRRILKTGKLRRNLGLAACFLLCWSLVLHFIDRSNYFGDSFSIVLTIGAFFYAYFRSRMLTQETINSELRELNSLLEKERISSIPSLLNELL